MHKFLIRSASGIVYAAVIILAIVHGGWSLWLLAIAFAVIGVCELDHMAVGFSKKAWPLYAIDVLGVLSLLSVVVCKYAIILWIALFTVRFFVSSSFQRKNPEYPKTLSYGQIYLGIPFLFMIGSSVDRLALLVFAMLWLNDSGAYIVGSTLGRHKMCPSVSPKKTWEGFIGGVLITLMGTWLLWDFGREFFGMAQYSLGMWMLLGAGASVFGTIGDLGESAIKRSYGVKDSGNWIPGHGGLLDRIDSFLIAYPVAYGLLQGHLIFVLILLAMLLLSFPFGKN